jgi:predicted Zn-dependent protease with MMP-like domain
LRWSRAIRASARVALAASLLLSTSAGAFSVHRNVFVGGGLDVERTILETPRWAAEPVNGTGLHDGIQVGVAAGFATALGSTPEEIPLVREAVVRAFDAWANDVLSFEVTFDANLATESYEITVDTFLGNVGLDELFGWADWTQDFVTNRLLTNGQRHDGWVLTHADIGINAPNVRQFRQEWGPILTDQQVLDALQRLVMHEAGHAIGLGHPTVDEVNLDTDLDPYNAMPIDPLAPWTGLFDSPFSDQDTIMSGLAYGSSFLALFDTVLHGDDAGGRDALYPVPVPTPSAAPTPTPTPLPPLAGDIPMCKNKRGRQVTVLVPPSKVQRSLDKGVTIGECLDPTNGRVMCKTKRGKRVNVLLPDSKIQRALDKGLYTLGECETR